MRVVGIGGTLRQGSSCEAALRIALDEAARCGAETLCFSGDHLRLPLYEPGLGQRTPEAAAMLAALRTAHGVILASPGYHGSISGAVKNALDYTEDMARDTRVYFDGLPVGCIATGHGAQGAANTLEALRAITHALRGFPTPFGAAICLDPAMFAGGACADEEVEKRLRLVGRQTAHFAALAARAAA